MIKNHLLLKSGLTAALNGFSQAPAPQSRIPEQVVVNGQQVSAAYVIAPGGGFQSFTCPAPQPYTMLDGTSQGWACYEQATGTWLLNALPAAPAQGQAPAQAQVQPPAVAYPQQPAVIYQQPAPTVVYAAPAYAPYPVVVPAYYGPSFVFGVGFGFGPTFVGGRYPVFFGGRGFRR